MRKRARSVGRGGKRGKTAGRGTKGQNSRAGHKKRPELRDIIKTLPKLRGRGKNIFKSFAVKPVAVNLSTLESCYSANDVVSPETLKEKNVISLFNGVLPRVKILSDGELSKKLTVKNCLMSQSAKVKLETAGGVFEVPQKA